MKCEACGGDSFVRDTRQSKTYRNAILRRRVCVSCSFRWSTLEIAGDFLGYLEKARRKGAKND